VEKFGEIAAALKGITALPSWHVCQCCQVVARIVRPSQRKIPQFGEKFHYFSGFSYLCDEILFGKDKCFCVISAEYQVLYYCMQPPFQSGDCLIIFCSGQYLANFQY
jgi:hypothetical protein